MKIKLLFVIESLYLGGGSERSMLSLLKYLDSEKYDIDLQIIYRGGTLEKEVPSYIKTLPAIPFTTYFSKNYIKALKEIRNFKQVKYLLSKIKFSYKIRGRSFRASEKAQFFWESTSSVIEPLKTEYDVAIAFAQNLPTFFVIDKVKAKKKIAWVNVTMKFPKYNSNYNYQFYKNYDKIIGITEDVSNHHQKFFPDLKEKFGVINNIIDHESVQKLSNSEVITFKSDSFNILTVSRFSPQKGYDILLDACEILINKNLNFHWYILGGGELENEIKSSIVKKKLQNHITLLGVEENPYPYFKAADLYVHTAKHEGYGRTLAEARMLNVPVVTTNFDTVHMQMIHEKNGLITEMNGFAVATGIERLLTDKKLYQSIVEYLKHEPKENTETVKRFDAMINELLSEINLK